MEKNKKSSVAANLMTAAMIAYALLVITRAAWGWVDYVFSVLFHLYLAGVGVTFALFIFYYAFFKPLSAMGRLVPMDKSGRPRKKVQAIFNAAAKAKALINSLLSLYCLTILVAGLCLNPVFGLCIFVPIIAAAEAKIRTKSLRVNSLIKAEVVSLILAFISSAAIRLSTGVPAPNLTIALLFLYMTFGFFTDRLFFSFEKTGLWSNVTYNKIPLLAAALLLFITYFSWIPNLNKTGRPPIITSKHRIGGGAGIEFTSDGKSLIYLNKSHSSVDLINRRTLEKEATVGVFGYPRQMARDAEKKLIYIAVYGTPYRQLEIISESPFAPAAGVSFPRDICAQANAVGIDYKRNRILAGCDDSGRLFFIDRAEPGNPKEPIRDGPKGKGMVRIEIDEGSDRAFTFGCLLGPHINEIDLAKGRLARANLTGYLVWETLRDAPRKRIFLSVPFRSIVAVMSENDLKIKHVIKSGFGARALAIDQRGNRIFIGSQIASTVDIYDLKTLRRLSTFYLPFPRFFQYDEKERVLYAAGTKGIYKVKI
ncbi:MAG TPA: hypothetical protein PLQ76_00070 [bacterium]|nr:hypothetical protein [bacterium]